MLDIKINYKVKHPSIFTRALVTWQLRRENDVGRLFFRAFINWQIQNVKILINFCEYGTVNRKTLVIIVKFYLKKLYLKKESVHVQRKYFFSRYMYGIFGNKTLCYRKRCRVVYNNLKTWNFRRVAYCSTWQILLLF